MAGNTACHADGDAKVHVFVETGEEITARVRILLGRYQLDELIGRGGMGAVYRALDLQNVCECAVKVLSLGALEPGDAGRKRFVREASVIAKLAHPSIVEIRDFGYAEDGSPFFVMELLKGQDLYRVISKQHRLPLPAVLHILRQVGGALTAMHGAFVLHRDIKPQNIFICCEKDSPKNPLSPPFGIVKLVDFGLSTPIGAESLTAAGSIIGTLEYLAPEGTYGKSQALDTFSDQWSLAVMAYRMLCGYLPFTADNWINLAIRIREARPVPLHEREPALPAHVCAAVHQALSLRKSDRYPSIAAFIRALCGELPARHDAPLLLPTVAQGSTLAPAQPGKGLDAPAAPQAESRGQGESRARSAERSSSHRKLLTALLLSFILCGMGLGARSYVTSPTLTQDVSEKLSAVRIQPAKPQAGHQPEALGTIHAPVATFLSAPLSPSSKPPAPRAAPLAPPSIELRSRVHFRSKRLLPATATASSVPDAHPRSLDFAPAFESDTEQDESAAAGTTDSSASPSGHEGLLVPHPSSAPPLRAVQAPGSTPPAASSRFESCGQPPQLPLEVKQTMHASKTLIGVYELCTDKHGKVSSVRAVRGIPGADDAILSTLRAWRCQPWPVPVCAPLELEFVLE